MKTQLVMRAIGVSHTACKDEFRRNLRSHSLSVFSFVIVYLMLRLRVVLRVPPSPSSVRSLLVLLLCKQRWLSCLSRGWGTIRALQRRSASDKCSVRCRPIKPRDKFYRNLFIKTYLPAFDEVHFCLFFRNLPQILPSGQFLNK